MEVSGIAAAQAALQQNGTKQQTGVFAFKSALQNDANEADQLLSQISSIGANVSVKA